MALAPDEFSNVNFAAQNIKILLEGKTSCLQVVRGGGGEPHFVGELVGKDGTGF
jgi:hypothetical protein